MLLFDLAEVVAQGQDLELHQNRFLYVQKALGQHQAGDSLGQQAMKAELIYVGVVGAESVQGYLLRSDSTDIGLVSDQQEEAGWMDAVQGFAVQGAADERIVLTNILQTMAVPMFVHIAADWTKVGRVKDDTECSQVGRTKVFRVKSDLLSFCSFAAIRVFPSCRSGNRP